MADSSIVQAFANAISSGVGAYNQSYNQAYERNQRDRELNARLQIAQQNKDFQNKELGYKQLSAKVEAAGKGLVLGDDDSVSVAPDGLLAPKLKSDIDKNNSEINRNNAQANFANSKAKGLIPDENGSMPYTKDDEKEINKFGQRINSSLASSRSPLGKSKQVLDQTGRLDVLFQQFPDGNIPKAQTATIATATAAIEAGGTPQSQHAINQMMFESGMGTIKDFASWITNNPQGRQQQAAIKLLKDASDREKLVAQDQIRQAIGQEMGSISQVMNKSDRHRQAVFEALKWNHVTPDMVDMQNGIINRPQQSVQPQAPGLQSGGGMQPQGDAATAPQPASPSIGFERQFKGSTYKFRGGDFRDQKNWMKVK